MKDLRETSFEVLQAVMPAIIVIVLLQFFIVQMPLEAILQFIIGAAMVTGGFFLFLLGVRIGLLPIGEMIGAELPKRGSVILLIVFAFILGFAVTVAEPDVRVLAHQVDFASDGQIGSNILIMTTALGVGIFVTLAMLRIVLGVPIAYLFGAGYILILAVSFFVPPQFVPIAFDAGGVTTGPLTVPFILSLGIGLTSVLGGKSSINDGFGIVGLASIGPVLAVMLLGVIYY